MFFGKRRDEQARLMMEIDNMLLEEARKSKPADESVRMELERCRRAVRRVRRENNAALEDLICCCDELTEILEYAGDEEHALRSQISEALQELCLQIQTGESAQTELARNAVALLMLNRGRMLLGNGKGVGYACARNAQEEMLRLRRERAFLLDRVEWETACMLAAEFEQCMGNARKAEKLYAAAYRSALYTMCFEEPWRMNRAYRVMLYACRSMYEWNALGSARRKRAWKRREKRIKALKPIMSFVRKQEMRIAGLFYALVLAGWGYLILR